MRTAIRKYSRDFVALIALALVGIAVGGYILANERFYLPSWVPLVGSDFVSLKAQMTTAQSVTPGQGQVVTIAGVGTWPRAASCVELERVHQGRIPRGLLRTVVPAAPAAWVTAPFMTSSTTHPMSTVLPSPIFI